MAVAVKNPNPVPARSASPRQALAMTSWVAVLYVLGSLLVVFAALPPLWAMLLASLSTTAPGLRIDSFASGSLLLLLRLAVGIGLAVLGGRLLGASPPRGLRGGAFLQVVGLLAAGLAVWLVGHLVETMFPTLSGPTGQGIVLGLAIAAVVAVVRYSFRPEPAQWALAIEDQGWFSTSAYKPAQGLKVRRGTLGAVLVLGATGVYSLEHGFGSGSSNWLLPLPFFAGPGMVILPDAQFTLPLIVIAATLWLGFRLVNVPTFADFLIATEGELNKVSWTTGRRLAQDTLVVLTTLVLFTLFLFFVDVFWGWFLTFIGVIRTTTGISTGDPGAHW